MEVLGGMLVFAGIAAAHVPALQAKAQVYPAIAACQALFTAVGFGRYVLDMVQMRTVRHGSLPEDRFLNCFRYESESEYYPNLTEEPRQIPFTGRI
jgi:hypothetical protein